MGGERVDQKAGQGGSLVEPGVRRLLAQRLVGVPAKDVLDAVVGAVTAEKTQIDAEIGGNRRRLQVLAHQLVVDFQAVFLVQAHHVREVHPGARGDELAASPLGLHVIETVGAHIKEANDCRMSPARHSVLAPCCKVGLHLDALHAVHRHDVELTSAFVVFERIAGADDHPTVGDAVVAKHLALQESKHHGHKRLAYAVDLVEEQDALPTPRLLDTIVDTCDDLAHRVFRDVDVALAVAAFRDERQAHGRLARVMRHGVVHKP